MARDTGTRDTRPQTNGRAKRYVAPYKKEFAAYSRTPVQSKVMRAARIFIVLSLAAVVFPEAAIAGDLRIPGRADESGARYLRSPVQSADGSTALAPNTHGADLPFQARLATEFNFPEANFSGFGNIFCQTPDACFAIGTSSVYYSEPDGYFNARWGITYKPPKGKTNQRLGSWVNPKPSTFAIPRNQLGYWPSKIKCTKTWCATFEAFDNGTRLVYKYSKTPYRFTLLADLQSTILPNTTYLGSTEELTCAERGNYCLIKGWNGLLDNSTGAWVGNWSAYTVANGKLRPVRIGPLLTKVYKFALKKVNFQNDEYYFDTHVVCLPSGSKCFAEIIPRNVIKKVLGKNAWYQAVYDRKTNLFEIVPMKFAKGTNMRPEVTMKVLSTWTYEPATCIGDSFCFVAIVIGNQVGTMYWDGKVWTVMPFNVTRFPEELRPENKNKSFLIGTFGVDCISAWACFLVGAVEQWAENATTYEAVGDYIWLYEPRTKRSEQMLHYSLAPRTETRRFFNGIKCVPERSVCHVSMWSSQLPSSMWAITPIRT